MGDSALFARLKLPPGIEGQHQLDAQSKKERMLEARSLAQWLQKADPTGEFVPGYDSVLATFNPAEISFPRFAEWFREQIHCLEVENKDSFSSGPTRIHRLPVVYGGKYGPDLEEVAELNGITATRVIELHTAATYSGYMVGFSPGFTYLGPLPPGLDAPRRPVPRPKVPPCTVAMAAGLTGIYPAAMPGGWRLIGYSPSSMFEAESDPPIRILPGDEVHFYPIQVEQLEEFEAKRSDLTSSLVEKGFS